MQSEVAGVSLLETLWSARLIFFLRLGWWDTKGNVCCFHACYHLFIKLILHLSGLAPVLSTFLVF